VAGQVLDRGPAGQHVGPGAQEPGLALGRHGLVVLERIGDAQQQIGHACGLAQITRQDLDREGEGAADAAHHLPVVAGR
jgi:hypothetical protein